MPFSVFNAAGAALNQSLTDTPVGSIQPFAGASAPSGWLFCDGAAVSRTDYAELFAVLGTTYGTGNGSTTFNVPDLRGRVPAGLDNMGGNAASRLTNTVLSASNTLGATGGSQTHTLTTAQMPSHTHSVANVLNSVSGSAAVTAGSSYAAGTVTSGSAGSDNAHTNTQPTLVVNYIILASSLATRLQAAALPQYVTSLPSSPVDGQTVVYAADASNGVMWTLRYRAASSSSYKWECLSGGSLLVSDNSATNSFTSTWTALGGTATIPLAGDYDVSFGAMIYGDSATGRDFWLKAATSQPSTTTDSAQGYVNNGTGRDQSYRTARLTGLSASASLQIWGKCSTGTTYGEQRNIVVRPVRVG